MAIISMPPQSPSHIDVSDKEKLLQVQHRSFHRRALIIGSISILTISLVLLAIILPISLKHKRHGYQYVSLELLSSTCNSTRYPDVCYSSLASALQSSNNSLQGILEDAIMVSIDGITKMLNLVLQYKDSPTSTIDAQAAYTDCMNLLGRSNGELANTLSQVTQLQSFSKSQITEIQTWMSAALTYHTSCTDELDRALDANSKSQFDAQGSNVAKLLSNALSITNLLIESYNTNGVFNATRRLTSMDDDVDQFPEWLTSSDQNKLTSTRIPKADVIVAADGTGQFKKIQDAIDASPTSSSTKYVIYIKRGIYKENLVVSASKTNLMLVGAGIKRTIITSDRSVMQSGITTMTSATLGVDGWGFLARDLTIANTAGPSAQQAVALRVSADQTAFYHCGFVGYQDTLLAHVFRQFYRNCSIYGTVDFIFGNAAAVFQKCLVRSRAPITGQQDVVAAQGRTDPAQSTGFSFHECTISGASPTFLGRPWKEFARVVYMKCFMLDVVDPTGWLPWQGTNFGIGTLYFGEYLNSGAGSGVEKRVNWSTLISDSQTAVQFTLSDFIDGNSWLSNSGIPFENGL